MNEKDILKSLALNFSERKNAAALNKYEVLFNNIVYVNQLFYDLAIKLDDLNKKIEQLIIETDMVNDEFNEVTSSKQYFKKIIPRILKNDFEILKKFLIVFESDEIDKIDINNVGKLRKEFIDYSNLVTTTRQTLDSMVSDAYQLIMLDAKELNFHVLTSLKSFELYATKSIRHSLFNQEIEDALSEFDNLNYNQRVRGVESDITKCTKKNFGDKIDYIFTELNLDNQETLKEELKNLFRFSSEFTHIGYTSTLFTSSDSSDIIFGSDIGPYLLSTENFNELKYEILSTMMRFISEIYLKSISFMVNKVYKREYAIQLSKQINDYITEVNHFLQTRNNTYYFFIKEGLKDSDEIIELQCMCGVVKKLEPPHDLAEIYCKGCGSSFNLIEVEGDPGYIMTSMGPIKVIGSDVPEIFEMKFEDRKVLFDNWRELMNSYEEE